MLKLCFATSDMHQIDEAQNTTKTSIVTQYCTISFRDAKNISIAVQNDLKMLANGESGSGMF